MQKQNQNEKQIYKEEYYRVIMPLSANSDIFNHNKFEVKIHSPDEDDVRQVILRLKKSEKKAEEN